MNVPKGLIKYYSGLVKIGEIKETPRCPICRKEMKYIQHEFIFLNDEIRVIRKFKCFHCNNNEVLLWRK